MANNIVLSLDCWGTLARTTPVFWQNYSDRIRTTLKLDVSSARISQISKKINTSCDIASEKTGEAIDQNIRITKLLSELNILTNEDTVNLLISELNLLIGSSISKTIILTDPSIVDVLNEVKRKKIKVILCSNTGFISGKQTTIILNKLGLRGIDYHFYSDEMRVSKPTNEYVKLVLSKLRPASGSHFTHFGDDQLADNLIFHTYKSNVTILSKEDAGRLSTMIRDRFLNENS